MFRQFTLNIRGTILEIKRPLVMGVVNVTPDSFYSGSRVMGERDIAGRAEEMLAEGVDIIDIGGCSSRPGAPDISAEEEAARVCAGLRAVRSVSKDTPVSVDTYRASVAEAAVTMWGADIVNDIFGGTLDPDMFATVGRLGVPYVLMHMRGTPMTMQAMTDYVDVTAEVVADLSRKLRTLRLVGVRDVILDPGFGFGKTTEQNFKMLRDLEVFATAFDEPLLVGFSRKSMITKTLGIDAKDALAGTVALNTLALDRGASILRVHDVREAAQTIKLFTMTNKR